MILPSFPLLASVIVFVFGAIAGSFLNVCIVRLRTVSVQGPRVVILYWSLPPDSLDRADQCGLCI